MEQAMKEALEAVCEATFHLAVNGHLLTDAEKAEQIAELDFGAMYEKARLALTARSRREEFAEAAIYHAVQRVIGYEHDASRMLGFWHFHRLPEFASRTGYPSTKVIA